MFSGSRRRSPIPTDRRRPRLFASRRRHPRLHERAFVLEPLAEIEPELTHPLLGISIAKLAEAVRNPEAVRRTDLTPHDNT